jgi:hypothetical protein
MASRAATTFASSRRVDTGTTTTSWYTTLSSLSGKKQLTFQSPNVKESAFTTCDVNGDGYADIVAAFLDADIAGSVGGAYVVFGNQAFSWPTFVDPAALNGQNGFVIASKTNGYFASVACGDVNGDRYKDIILGDAAHHIGWGLVVLGKPSNWGAQIRREDLDGSNGFQIQPNSFEDYRAAFPVASCDFNGDGIDNILTGGWVSHKNVFVIFGKRAGWVRYTSARLEDGINASTITVDGDVVHGFDYYTLTCGDVNGDKIADIIIGQENAPGGRSDKTKGEVHVVFGKTGQWDGSINTAGLNGVNGFKIYGLGQYTGNALAAGDINGDGYDDIIIDSAYGSGCVALVFGKGSFSSSAVIQLQALDHSSDDFVLIIGLTLSVYTNNHLAVVDINKDGNKDIIIGSTGWTHYGDTGCVHILFGKSGKVAAWSPRSYTRLQGSPGVSSITIYGENEGGKVGAAVTAGDINGDSNIDVLFKEGASAKLYVVTGPVNAPTPFVPQVTAHLCVPRPFPR